MLEVPRHGVVSCHSKGGGTWHLLTRGIFSVPGRRVVPQHGGVRCPDDHGRDAVHGLHLQPLCYQRGSVSAFLLFVLGGGERCVLASSCCHRRPCKGPTLGGQVLFSPKEGVLPSPAPASHPVSTLEVAELKVRACDEARAVPLGALLRGQTGCSPGLSYFSKLIGGEGEEQAALGPLRLCYPW